MKKVCFLILCLLSISNSAFAQKSPRHYKGRVIDSVTFKPLPDASICIYRASDTSLLNFGFTTPNGNFMLNTNSSDSLIIIVSLFGYKEFVKKDPASEGWDFSDFGDIKLNVLPYEFQSFSVKTAAIRMKGDTIEINASRFKVLPGSDVAQLFKKIPGFEVNVKGEIKVNGSPITKIMVDGSDFFGNNPGMVSKNLSADMIETVQVFEDLNEDGSPKNQSSKIINLKLKKGKRNGTFGDLMAGYGTTDRYETGARLNNFKNDRKLSFIINGNNINETGFDFGFDNWHGSYGAERNGVGNDDDFFFYSSNNNKREGNINNRLSSGFSYFNEFSKKRKLSVNASATRNNYNSIEASTIISPFNDTTTRSNTDSSILNGRGLSGSLDINYSRTLDSTGRYDFGISSLLTGNRSTTDAGNIIRLNNALLNSGVSSLLNNSQSRNMEVHGNIRRMLRKDLRYLFIGNISYNYLVDENQSYQFVQNALDTFNNLNERLTERREMLVKVLGRMPVYKKLMFNLSADRWQQNNTSEQLSHSALNRYSNAFEQVYTNRIDTLSIKLDNRLEQYTVKPYFSVSRKQFYFSTGVTFMHLDLTNRFRDSMEDISRNYQKVLPFISFTFYPSKAYIYFNASKSTNFPTIAELLPILNISDNYQRQTGNRDLNPQDNYEFKLYANLYKLKGFRYFYGNINGSTSDNAKIWVNRQNADGVIVKTPENAKGKREIYAYVGLSKKLSKLLYVDLRSNMSLNKNPLVINGQNAFGRTKSLFLKPGFTFSKSDSLELSFGMSYDYTSFDNSLNESLDFTQSTYGYYTEVRALLKTATEFNSSFNLEDQRNVPGIGKIVPVWNAYIQQPLSKKSNYSVKLSAYDILKRNTNISRSTSENYIYINQSNRLQQYFMLSLIYKIRKMGGEEEGMNYSY